jgi:hypothetical protein
VGEVLVGARTGNVVFIEHQSPADDNPDKKREPVLRRR